MKKEDLEYSKKIGDRIKTLLKERNIKQNDFAKNYFFCDPTVFSRKLNGVKHFTTRELQTISKLLNVDLGFLLLDYDDPHYQTKIDTMMAKSTDERIDSFIKDNANLICAIESKGYSIEVFPSSGGYDSAHNTVHSHLRIEVYKNGMSINAFDEDGWNRFTEKIKCLIEFALLSN